MPTPPAAPRDPCYSSPVAHPLEDVMGDAEGFLLIGDSSQDRFPGFSYNAFTQAGRRFYCLDMGGLRESRGPTRGGKVYPSVDELPTDDLGDLALVWVKPRRSREAVELAHAAGCTRIWFSFETAHADAVERAVELGMQVVEVGRCPVYYVANTPPVCRAHTTMVRLTGTRNRPPQTSVGRNQRTVW
jgi:hypothetical protein